MNSNDFDWFGKKLATAQKYIQQQAKDVYTEKHIIKSADVRWFINGKHKPSKEAIREKFFADRWIADSVVDRAMIKMREV